MWDLASGTQRSQPVAGHEGQVRALAVGQINGQPVAVSSGDRTVRVLDLDGSPLCVIDVGARVTTLAVRSPTIVVGAYVGVMVLELMQASRVAT